MRFTFGNFSRELDNTDAEVVRIYEEKLEEFYKRAASVDMKGRVSEIYRQLASAGEDIFEAMFGEGAVSELFGDGHSLGKVIAALRALNGFMCDLSSVIEEIRGIKQ